MVTKNIWNLKRNIGNWLIIKRSYKYDYRKKFLPNIEGIYILHPIRATYWPEKHILALFKYPEHTYIELPDCIKPPYIKKSKFRKKYKTDDIKFTYVELDLYEFSDKTKSLQLETMKKIRKVYEAYSKLYKKLIKIKGVNVKIEITQKYHEKIYYTEGWKTIPLEKKLHIYSDNTEPIVIDLPDDVDVYLKDGKILDVRSLRGADLGPVVDKILNIKPINKYTGKGFDILNKEDRKNGMFIKDIVKKKPSSTKSSK